MGFPDAAPAPSDVVYLHKSQNSLSPSRRRQRLALDVVYFPFNVFGSQYVSESKSKHPDYLDVF